jgi:hypothetical protein
MVPNFFLIFLEQSGVKSVLRFDPVTAGKRLSSIVAATVIDTVIENELERKKWKGVRASLGVFTLSPLGLVAGYMCKCPVRRLWIRVKYCSSLCCGLLVLPWWLPHRMADWGGRRNFVVLYAVVYGASCHETYVSHISCESFLYLPNAVFAKLLSTPIPFHRLRASTKLMLDSCLAKAAILPSVLKSG